MSAEDVVRVEDLVCRSKRGETLAAEELVFLAACYECEEPGYIAAQRSGAALAVADARRTNHRRANRAEQRWARIVTNN